MSEQRDRLADKERLQNVTDSMKTVLEMAIRHLIDSIEEKQKLVKSHFVDSIATELNSFKEDLLNLGGVLTPDNVGNAFIFPGTRSRIEKHVDAYGSSRNILAKRRDSKWSYIYDLWGKDEGIRLTRELAEVYSFALDTINTTYLLPLNEGVFDRIDDVGTGKKPRIGTKSKAVKEMKIAAPALKQKTEQFVELLCNFLEQFKGEQAIMKRKPCFP